MANKIICAVLALVYLVPAYTVWCLWRSGAKFDNLADTVFASVMAVLGLVLFVMCAYDLTIN